MKIKFGNVETGETFSEWELNSSQQRFWDSKKKFVLFSGGYGCLAPETKILDADTGEETEIQHIHAPFRVFSHNGKKAWALTPVRYEKSSMYTVKTGSYELTGTGEHRLLTENGWKKVRDLSVGEPLLVSSSSLPRSTPESFRSVLFSGVLHLIRTLQGCLGGYHPVRHFYGGQPRLAKGISLETPPQPVDVHVRNLGGLNEGDRSVSRGHTRSCLESFPPSRSDSSPSGKHPLVLGVEGCTCLGVSGHAFVSDRFFLRLLAKIVRNTASALAHSVLDGSFLCKAYPYPTVRIEKVQSISYARDDYYYDLHVLGTNSYYAQGFFSHNCGKSLMLTLKAIDLALRYPKNYILMGRRTYPELRDTLMKEFFTICPDHLIKDFLKAEGRVIFYNGSEIIFRHLDTMAESEIRSLNLGQAFIDQAEDVSREVFVGLRGRLRREGIPDHERKIYMSCNPALTWLFDDFKLNPQPEYEVIEASTLENRKNLPAGYIEDLMKYPESYRRQYVEGIWDMSLLSDNAVFAREHIDQMVGFTRNPERVTEGLRIFKEFVPGHRYQMGIDAAEGGETSLSNNNDEAALTIVDLNEGEEVASWAGRVPPDVLADLAYRFSKLYSDKNTKCLLIPEMNSIGLALVNKLKSFDVRIFKREEYDKTYNKKLEKLGWRTTRQTKPLLVSRFQELLRLRNPRIYSKETVDQMRSFVYTDVAKKQGMGAKEGFHDDRLFSLLLAFWEKGEVKGGKFTAPSLSVEKQSSLTIKRGIITKIPQLDIEPSSLNR